eukprot:gene6134-7392_t
MDSSFFLLVVAAVISATANAGLHHSERGKPHIIFIVIDDLGFDDLGFKSHQIKTPNIDRLYNESLLLTNYYVQDVCSPTRASIMTGRYAMHHGIVDWIPPESPYGLNLDETTIANKLLEGGYDTHAWHLGFYQREYTPTYRGFNSFLGFYSGGEDYFTHIEDGAYDMHHDPTPHCGEDCSQLAFDLNNTYSTTAFSEHAVNIIRKHNVSQPLFLYLAYQAVHAPAEAPDQYIEPYADLIPDMQRRIFAGMLSCLDEGIGNVTKELKDKGMYDDALIVFTTDNGGPILGGDAVGARNYPLRGGKHSIYQGGMDYHFNHRLGVHGISFLKPQDGAFQQPETNYYNLMHAADWLPTLCDAVGITCNTSKPLDGVSHWDAMVHARNETIRSKVVLGNSTDLCPNDDNCGFAFIDERWKYMRGSSGSPFSWSIPCTKSGDHHNRLHSSVDIQSDFNLLRLANSCNLKCLLLFLREFSRCTCISTCQGTCNVVYNQCYNGDIVGSTTVPSLDDCCFQCWQSKNCSSFTYREKWSVSNCILMSSVGNASIELGCTSGRSDPREVPVARIEQVNNQLFDIKADPYEIRDVSSSFPEVVAKMDKQLSDILETYHQAHDDPNCPFSEWPITKRGRVMVPWC